jgi:type I restriction enzyme R subunit
MRDKRELIEKFIDRMTPEKGNNVYDDWEKYVEEEKRKELESIIKEENLKAAETEDFIERAFSDGYVTETGTGITNILPPSNPFLPESGQKKQTVIEKLKAYLNKFANMLSDDSAGFDVYRKRKLASVEEDKDVHNLIDNLLRIDKDMSALSLQREALEKFGDIYPGMSPNDWRHIIESYTKNQGNNESSDFQIADEYPMEMGLKVAEDIE